MKSKTRQKWFFNFLVALGGLFAIPALSWTALPILKSGDWRLDATPTHPFSFDYDVRVTNLSSASKEATPVSMGYEFGTCGSCMPSYVKPGESESTKASIVMSRIRPGLNRAHLNCGSSYTDVWVLSFNGH